MNIEVLLFAGLRERAGSERVVLRLDEDATVAVLLAEMARAHPALAPLLPRCRVALDQTFAEPSDPLAGAREVAVIPPVSGGHDGPSFCLRHEPLSLQAVVDAVTHAEAGGVTTFTGNVRRHSRGKEILFLRYEAYEPMAVQALENIGRRIGREIPGSRLAIHHRLGQLAVGETAVVIAASAAHRAEAFAACRQAIEQLKQDVPIWKLEVATDGAHWVGETP